MSEELLLDLPATKASAKKAAVKKAPAKKAAAKKTAAKKAPAKKAAKTKPAAAPVAAEVVEIPVVVPEIPQTSEAPEQEKKPAAKKRTRLPGQSSSVLKKAASILRKMNSQGGMDGDFNTSPPPAAPVEELVAKPAPAVETADVRAPQEVAAPSEPVAVVIAEPEPAPTPTVAAAEPTTAPESVQTGLAQTDAAPRPPAHADTPAEPGVLPERKKSKFERWKERRERFRQEKLARRLAAQNGNGENPTAEYSNGEDDRARTPEIVLGPPEAAEGIIEMTPKGYGFLRRRELVYAQHPHDAFISAEFIRQYGLREGMEVKGIAQKGPRGPQITSVNEVNGRAPEAMRDTPLFEELKAINPCKKIQLETDKDRLTTRVIDMFTPVGRGQRGLIVAPPRAGKTTLLQHIAEAVVANHPAMHLMILLVDERPEEVTEFKRILPKAEIYASSNDQDVKSHTRISTLAIERAKRLVECGEHVFMLMDSITRLARAFNNSKSGGATMSGGMGVGAMEIPRRLFAAARNTREAGSLTVLATALVETGSRMDELIFQEFKGTGNMELVLDRKIAEQFYYPAVNIFKSGTRREELLLQAFQLDKIHMLRRGLAGHKPIDAIQRVLTLMERYPSNAQMLVDLPSKG